VESKDCNDVLLQVWDVVNMWGERLQGCSYVKVGSRNIKARI
jgi:hypothetical protein